MGNNDAASSVEKPAHSVYLDVYAIDKYEVTNKLYKGCVEVGCLSATCMVEF